VREISYGLCLFGIVACSVRAQGGKELSASIVPMRPFIVEASRVDPHPWYYAATGDSEILGRCDPDTIRKEAHWLANDEALERQVVARSHLTRLTVPMTVILFDFRPPPALAAVVPERIEEVPPPRFGPNEVRHWSEGGIDVWDEDTHCAVQNRWGIDWNGPGGNLGHGPVPTALWYRLSRCEPPLPLWYQYGWIGPCGLFRAVEGSDGVRIASAVWVSAAETRIRLGGATREHPPNLPAVEKLFRSGPVPGTNPVTGWPPPEWMAEAALFLRWGLFGRENDEAPHSGAFARFLERSRTEPVTEFTFRECFGFGYAEMQARLERYFVIESQEPLAVGHRRDEPWPPSYESPPVRKATADQIGRILGDWLRMEGNRLRNLDPGESAACFAAAGRVLERAYREDNGLPPDEDPVGSSESAPLPTQNAGAGSVVLLQPLVVNASRIHDSLLLAVYGMYEHDTGNNAQAAALLRAAAK
jgi:hypothetical protein